MHFDFTPHTVVFAGNPLRYRVHLDDEGDPGTGKSVIEIAFTEKDSNVDHSITVSFLGMERTFSLKSSPSDAFSLPTADTDAPLTDWVRSFYDSLQKNGEILKNYQVSLSDDGLKIILSAYVSDASLDMTVISNTLSGVTLNTVTSGGGTPAYDGVAVMVLDKDGSLLGEDLKPINYDTQKIDFEVSEYLAALFSDLVPPRFYLETQGNNFLFIYTDLVVKYRLLAGYHTPGLVYVSLYDDYHWAIAGGLSREALVAWNQVSGGFWADASNKKRFLSWHPRQKKTSRTNHESLYFFSQYDDVTRYNVMVRAQLATGEEQTFQLTHLTYSLQYFVLEIMVGYGQISLESYVGNRRVVRYAVWLEDQDERKISEERIFEIDEKYYEFAHEFVFRNSFGVFDYFRFTGKREKNLEYERTPITVETIQEETYFNSPKRQINITESQVWKASSGWVDNNVHDFLRDFMRSDEIYEIVDGRPWRSEITSKKTSKYLLDGEYLYSLEFEYERSYTDTYYSNLFDLTGGEPPVELEIITADANDITADSEAITADQLYY